MVKSRRTPQKTPQKVTQKAKSPSAKKVAVNKQSRTNPNKAATSSIPNVLMIGTGEYISGWTGQGAAKSDKRAGVVGLAMLDLKRRGKVNRIGMCGTNGPKLPDVRAHMQKCLGPETYSGLPDPSIIETWPSDKVVDPNAYKTAIKAFNPGDVAIIFTPDDTHFDIAKACLEAGLHVMLTKPPVKTLAEHNELTRIAKKANLLCTIEVHKRFDPMYSDARDKIAGLGDFSYFVSYMSQPKFQLDVFKAWAGKSSDISYYLNSHHVDYHNWCIGGRSRPESVTALSSTGVADKLLNNGVNTEDTITLAVQWRNKASKNSFARGQLAHATYTSSWIAPPADVHTQQRWYYMGQTGEVNVSQCHRGYFVNTDDAHLASVNPLYWKPTPDVVTREFTGQRTYGYLTFEATIDAATRCNSGEKRVADFDGVLPTMSTTSCATAILEAGRISLDNGGRTMELVYANDKQATPIGIRQSMG